MKGEAVPPATKAEGGVVVDGDEEQPPAVPAPPREHTQYMSDAAVALRGPLAGARRGRRGGAGTTARRSW